MLQMTATLLPVVVNGKVQEVPPAALQVKSFFAASNAIAANETQNYGNGEKSFHLSRE